MSNFKTVCVEWDDALSTSDNSWKPLSEIQATPVAKVTSVGFMVTDEADRVIVVGSLIADGDAGGDVVIPRGMIRRITILEPVK